MQVYQHDNNRYYLGVTTAYNGLMPLGCVDKAPPPLPWARMWPQWTGTNWHMSEDHRARKVFEGFAPEHAQEATEYWLPGDTWQSRARTMTEIGPLPDAAYITDDKGKKTLRPRPEKPAPTQDEMRVFFTAAIQQHMDDFAKTRNYDNIMSACTYATSTVERFRVEGQYCVEARDATWAAGYALMDDVLSGKRPVPTLEEVFAALPVLAWPEQAEGGAA